MHRKNRMAIGVAVLAGSLLSGCGSTSSLSDQEFSDAALSTCSTLKEVTATLDWLSFGELSDAYAAAARELNALQITGESAPNGTLLRSYLAELADSYSLLEVAVEDAMAAIVGGASGSLSVMVADDGTFFAYPGDDMFDIERLDVDPSAWVAVQTNLTQVEDAAQTLGLSDCSPGGGA